MKKKLCICLALVLLLTTLGGCAQKDTTDSSESEPSIQIQFTETHGSTVNTPIDVIPPTAPADPGNSLLSYDPTREIYIFCGGSNVKISPSYSTAPSILVYIISTKALNLETMGLTLPIQSQYTVSKREIELEGLPSADQILAPVDTQFPYWLYQCYMGKDFAKLQELESNYHKCKAAYEKKLISEEEYDVAWDAYYTYMNAELTSYAALTDADLPQFYIYRLSANFLNPDGLVAETFHEATVLVDGTEYTLELGQVTIGSEIDLPAPLLWETGEDAVSGILGSGNAPQPYYDGLHMVRSYFSFTATRAMRLTGLEFEDPSHKLVEVWVELQTMDGMHSYEKWDMSEPIVLFEGDHARIDVVFQDDAMQPLDYATKLWGFLLFDTEKGSYCWLSECCINLGINYYALYAIIFQGMDLEDYYRDYYYPQNEPWRQSNN